MEIGSLIPPEYVEPMMARLQSELPTGKGWQMEVKLDGIRAIGIKNGKSVRLFSRRPRELTHDYPHIVNALADLPANKFVVDGEIVIFDEQGRTSFQALQNRNTTHDSSPAFFILFDLLQLNDERLLSVPLTERRKALGKLLRKPSRSLRFSAPLEGDPKTIWSGIKRLGLEGIIAKRADSVYEPGRRTGAWLKVKAQNEQEFVIGGYTPPQGSRLYFGSLLVGYYEGKNLLFASGVGTGFNTRSLETLYKQFQKLRVDKCPFTNLPQRGPRGGFPLSQMRKCFWLKPQLVCQVKFFEWTRDGNLRQPVFLGLREDKKATEVVREQVSS
jgi:bifunctional non-homologous end joining protein LigD